MLNHYKTPYVFLHNIINAISKLKDKKDQNLINYQKILFPKTLETYHWGWQIKKADGKFFTIKHYNHDITSLSAEFLNAATNKIINFNQTCQNHIRDRKNKQHENKENYYLIGKFDAAKSLDYLSSVDFQDDEIFSFSSHGILKQAFLAHPYLGSVFSHLLGGQKQMTLKGNAIKDEKQEFKDELLNFVCRELNADVSDVMKILEADSYKWIDHIDADDPWPDTIGLD